MDDHDSNDTAGRPSKETGVRGRILL